MKGETNLVIYFVLAVALIAIGLLFFNKLQSWKCVSNPFECQKNKLLISSVCVFERCVKGCEDPATKALQYQDFSCAQTCEKQTFLEFVKQKENTFNYDYCGLQYFVKFDIKDEELLKITIDEIKNYFKDSENYFECIVVYGIEKQTNIQDILKNEVQSNQGKIYVDRNIIEEFDESKNKKCDLPGDNYKEAYSITIKGPLTLYFSGGGEIFFVQKDANGANFVDTNPYLIFLTNEKYYKDVQEGQIEFRINRYYPLDEKNGIIFVATRDACGLGGEKINIYYDCDGKINGPESICADGQTQIEKEICGKYIIESDSLYLSNELSPLIFNIKFK